MNESTGFLSEYLYMNLISEWSRERKKSLRYHKYKDKQHTVRQWWCALVVLDSDLSAALLDLKSLMNFLFVQASLWFPHSD